MSFSHPPDNNFAKARWHPSLLDPSLKLTDEERQALQDEIDGLFALSKLTENIPY